MNTTPSLLSKIRALLAQDNISDALQLLHQLLEKSPQLDEAIQHSARYQAIRQKINLDLVSHRESQITKNQIRWSILELLKNTKINHHKEGLEDLIQEIETQQDKVSIKQEVEKAAKTVIQNAEKIYNIKEIGIANFS